MKVVKDFNIFEIRHDMVGAPIPTLCNTKHFKVQISNGLFLEWLIIAIAIDLVPTIPKLNNWRSKEMVAILFKTEHCCTNISFDPR